MSYLPGGIVARDCRIMVNCSLSYDDIVGWGLAPTMQYR